MKITRERSKCSLCAQGRDRCGAFAFDLRLSDGTELLGVELAAAGGSYGAALCGRLATGESLYSEEETCRMLMRSATHEARTRAALRVRLRGTGGAVEVCLGATPTACRAVWWPQALCRCAGGRPLAERLLALGLTEGSTGRCDVVELRTLADGEPVALLTPRELAEFLGWEEARHAA